MWKESYKIGVEHIDRQHKQLFEYVDAMAATLKKQQSFEDYKNQIVEAIGFLKQYCVEHFKDEEAYHLEIGLKDHQAHKQLHQKLVKDVLAHEAELTGSGFAPESVKKFLGFVLTWLIYHVAGEDQKLGTKAAAKAPDTTEVSGSVQDFATRAKGVLCTVTGLSDEDISFAKSAGSIKDGVGFKVGLVDGGGKKGVGLVYSTTIALGALKAMTSMEVDEINEITYSALQEISNIVSSRIADSVAAAAGIAFVDIEYPVQTPIEHIPKGNDSFIMKTSIGDMEVVVY
ncbi:MAG: hemerythrin domain-containing protein [Defluviitaleaceae bacterium]|nr:hemerythrin domain-containing protein [Defluviitaleaceae bacterium]